MPKVKILNQNQEVELPEGTNLRRGLLQNNTPLYPGIHKYLNCRGFALCAKCAVVVKNGHANCGPMGFREKLRLALSYLTIGRPANEIRLACQTRVNGDIQIETMPRLRM